MTKDAKELAAGLADKVLDEIKSTRFWDDGNYARGYVDGLARAMQILAAELKQMWDIEQTKIDVPHCDGGTEGSEEE